MKRLFSSLLIFVVTCGVYLGGHLSPLEYGLTDLGFRLASRSASEQIVIVEIDNRSLQQLNGWPWPRRYHAAVIDHLVAAGANQIALDIDFSAPTNQKDDEMLAAAIGRARGAVILPIFRQRPAKPGDGSAIIYTTPHEPIAKYAALGAVNIPIAADDTIRRYRTMDNWKGNRVPSMSQILAADKDPRRGDFSMDFAIQPDTIPRLSYVDALTGNFGPDTIAGKTIIIGATAATLGDQHAVPVYDTLPGAVVQAIAFESLIQGRALHEIGPAPLLATSLLLLILLGSVFERVSGRRGVKIMTGTLFLCAAVQVAVFAAAPVILNVAPFLLMTLLAFVSSRWQRMHLPTLPGFFMVRSAFVKSP